MNAEGVIKAYSGTCLEKIIIINITITILLFKTFQRLDSGVGPMKPYSAKLTSLWAVSTHIVIIFTEYTIYFIQTNKK
jgi:hypothetical protein